MPVPALPRCRSWRCVCAGAVGAVQEGRAGKRPSVSRLPASLRQSAAELRPLCGFGGRVPAGASGWREKWDASKAGSTCCPCPGHVQDPCAAPGSVPILGALATDPRVLRPGRGAGAGARAARGGLPPLRRFCFPVAEHPRTPLGAPGARLALLSTGREGESGERISSVGSRAALPSSLPPSLASRDRGRVSSAWR